MLRRVPIVASPSCARALTCLLQAVEREPKEEALAQILLFPRVSLAAPARGNRAPWCCVCEKNFEVRRSEPVHKLRSEKHTGGRCWEGEEGNGGNEGGTFRGGGRDPFPK